MTKKILLFCFFVKLGFGCIAQDLSSKAQVKIGGQVQKVLIVSGKDMQTMPRQTVKSTGKDGKTRSYQGVLLSYLLQEAGVSADKLGPKDAVKRYITVRATDKFEVVFSLAELDPVFGGQAIVLADKVDGKLLSEERGPFQIVVPNDKKPTRNIYQVTEVIVHTIKASN